MNKFLNLVMRFITAKQVFSGKEFLANDTVLVLNDNSLITDITICEKVETSNIEQFNGIICPGFINTHCHLELSHLKGAIKQHTGIVDFGLNVIKHRNDTALELQLEAMLIADKEMQENGIVAIGDISNTNLSIAAKKQSPLYYHTFVELIALNPSRANVVFNHGVKLASEFESNHLSNSLAPHASHTASLELIAEITNYCKTQQKPTSIHNQESEAENDFFKYKSGNYLKLYEALNISIDYFNATSKSSLQSISPGLNTDVNTLLVHNTFTAKKDIEIVQENHSNLYWCLCPNANLYIENTLPNISLLEANNCILTIGTDSLASNAQLSIIEEINCILNHQRNISLQTLLKAATYNGAQFLGIENQFGLLAKNKSCGVNLIEGKEGKYSVKKLA
jgi:cytosine/adenosine deaminase-related metal-dependent hydrolase